MGCRGGICGTRSKKPQYGGEEEIPEEKNEFGSGTHGEWGSVRSRTMPTRRKKTAAQYGGHFSRARGGKRREPDMNIACPNYFARKADTTNDLLGQEKRNLLRRDHSFRLWGKGKRGKKSGKMEGPKRQTSNTKSDKKDWASSRLPNFSNWGCGGWGWRKQRKEGLWTRRATKELNSPRR